MSRYVRKPGFPARRHNSTVVMRPQYEAMGPQPDPTLVPRGYEPLEGWSDDARKAITENPDYFVWWYTKKSMAVVAFACAATYFAGRYYQLKRKRC